MRKCSALLILCLFLSGFCLADNGEGKPRPKEKLQPTVEKDFSKCNRLLSPIMSNYALNKLFSEKKQSSNQGAAGNEELVQQSIMAFWSGILGWTAIAALIPTSASAILLAFSVRQTNRIIGTERAWVVTDYSKQAVKPRDDGGHTFTRHIINKGKSPAKKVSVKTWFEIIPGSFNDNQEAELTSTESSSFDVGILAPETSWPINTHLSVSEAAKISNDENFGAILQIEITYETPLSRGRKKTTERVYLKFGGSFYDTPTRYTPKVNQILGGSDIT